MPVHMTGQLDTSTALWHTEEQTQKNKHQPVEAQIRVDRGSIPALKMWWYIEALLHPVPNDTEQHREWPSPEFSGVSADGRTCD
jgi:hypothetical protein